MTPSWSLRPLLGACAAVVALACAAPAVAAPMFPSATRACHLDARHPAFATVKIDWEGSDWRIHVDPAISAMTPQQKEEWRRWQDARVPYIACLRDWQRESTEWDEAADEFVRGLRDIHTQEQLDAYVETSSPIQHPAYYMRCAKYDNPREQRDCRDDWGRRFNRALKEDRQRRKESYRDAILQLEH